MEMVFNELSQRHLAPNLDEARKHVKMLLDTIRAASQKGVSRQLRTSESFRNKPLADKYSWYNWSQDKNVPRELRHYFLSIATRAPYLDGLENTQEKATGFDILFEGEIAEGLGVAFLTGGLAVSLPSSPEWESPFVTLDIQELQEDGSLLKYPKEVHHASVPSHVDHDHTKWIEEALRQSVITADDLWQERNSLFPSLEFCTVVKKQMYGLPKGTLLRFLRGLRCLEEYCQQWQCGNFDQAGLGCVSSTETPKTLKEYGQERTFTCPDGTSRVFSHHVKLGDLWRIHYYPMRPGKIIIGYVGRHLNTSRYHH
ncbi:MAG: hypothetical protein HQL64_08965 [Magnetococcales bacterium]|nr:hypothetical protein [Magnetococcales bacterium]